MLVFALYRDTAMVGSFPKALGLWLLLVFFGAAVIPLSYCYAFCFSSHASAQVRQFLVFFDLVESAVKAWVCLGRRSLHVFSLLCLRGITLSYYYSAFFSSDAPAQVSNLAKLLRLSGRKYGMEPWDPRYPRGVEISRAQ